MKKYQKELETYFQPPKPKRKEEFLGQFSYADMGIGEFVFTQAGYIQKSSWIFSLLLFIMAAAAGRSILPGGGFAFLRSFAVCMPFWVLIIARESARSRSFHMMELELSTRHRLEEIILARIGILGSLDVLLFIPVCIVLAGMENLHVLQVVLYLMLPFLVTTFLSLFIARVKDGKNTIWYCLAVSVFMSVGYQVFGIVFDVLPGIEKEGGAFLCCIILCVGIGVQVKKLKEQMGEMAWNL